MSIIPAWEPTPASITVGDASTTVSYYLRNGQTREQGMRTPHTFQTQRGTMITNLFPDDVVVERGRVLGRWVVSAATSWKATPQSVRRQDYNTLVVTFEPEVATKNREALANARHTFVVEDTKVVNQKPDKVVPMGDGVGYGLWLVQKLLRQPAWSPEPFQLPVRHDGDRNRFVIEFQFFVPPGGQERWSVVAKTAVNTFVTAGVSVSRPPDTVETDGMGHIIGSWTVVVPTLEGYQPEFGGGCPLRPHARWLVLLVMVMAAVAVYVHFQRKRT